LHQIQVVVRRYLKYPQNLVKHLPVLGSDTDPAFKAAIDFQCKDNRRQLDRLRPGTEHYGYFSLREKPRILH
jgi:hypothetical protein